MSTTLTQPQGKPILAQKPIPQPPLHKFRLISGSHAEDGPPDANGLRTPIIYTQGAIIETRSDLDRLNSNLGRKFERIVDEEPNPDELAQQGYYPVGHPALMSQQVGESKEAYATRMKEMIAQAQAALAAPSTSPVVATATKATKDAEPSTTDGIERMNLKQLQAFAAEEEIDLKGTTNRDEAIKIIRTAMRG